MYLIQDNLRAFSYASVFPAVSKRRDLYIEITIMLVVDFMVFGEETGMFL